jgi:hypothetical protein
MVVMKVPRRIPPLLLGLAVLSAVAAADDDARFAGNACVECHRDLPGRSSAIVELEWKKSVHHAAGTACDDCHGGNAALRREQFDSDEAWKRASHLQRDPEFMFMSRTDGAFVSGARGRSVSYFCGKCHADIKAHHLGSPHGEFGDPTCLYCHGEGSHAIQDPTLDIIDVRGRAEGGRCSPCHLASTMNSVTRIKTTLEACEQRIRETAEQIGELEEWGYRNLDLQRRQQDARQLRSRLRQIFHSFDMLEINNFAAEIQLTADRITATHGMVEKLRTAQRQQAGIGALAVVMLLSFAGLLVYYRHRYLNVD